MIRTNWTNLKTYIISRPSKVQYVVDRDINYVIYASNDEFELFTEVAITTPKNADQIDFETNYLPTANQIIYTKLVGTSSTGVEQTPIASTGAGEIRSASILNLGTGTQGALTVGTTAVEIRVGASPLANRKMISLFNNSNNTLYWGFSNGVTIANGTPIFKNQLVTWDVGPSQSVFVIAGSAGNNTRITEA